MIEIAGGIILAVLFFMFLPLIINCLVEIVPVIIGVIGIGLLVILCVLIYFLLRNNVGSENANLITFSIFIITGFIYIIHDSYNWFLNKKFLDNNSLGNTVNNFYISDHISFAKRHNIIRSILLKEDGINSVVIHDFSNSFIVNFNTYKISHEDIKIIINKLIDA